MRPNAVTFVLRGASQLRRFGWRLLWYRYVKRRAILRAPAIVCPENADLEVHIQVCDRDWLNALWTLHSFQHFAARPFRLLVLCDRSVTDPMQARLRTRLPGASVVPCDPPPEAVRACFSSRWPTLFRLRTSGIYRTLPKVMDSYALRRREVILSIDPDVLFFAPPDELLADLDPARACFARFNVPRTDTHRWGGFALDEEVLYEQFHLRFPPRFGCGLGSVNYARADWDFIEQVVSRVPPDPARSFLLDQTIYALWCERVGWDPLPTDRYTIEPVANLEGVVTRHYFGKTRDLLYVEGIPHLLALSGFSSRFARRITPSRA